MWKLVATLLVGSAMSIVTSAALAQAGAATVSNWPALTDPVKIDPAIEARITSIMAKMSLEQKVGQVVQGDLGSVSPDDVARYHLGSVLNGGNSDPPGKRFGTGADWLAEADRFYDASVRPSDNLPIIPIIWGSDAVHGHSNVIGATLFPHNIGLGAMRNPELMRQIGEVTAREMRVTGLDWTFAPTLAVVRDDRWGRTYEGYSENPEIVASYAGAFVEGLQGESGPRTGYAGHTLLPQPSTSLAMVVQRMARILATIFRARLSCATFMQQVMCRRCKPEPRRSWPASRAGRVPRCTVMPRC
jgi:beta-glucosidase